VTSQSAARAVAPWEIVTAFDIPGACVSIVPFGKGHINDTYLSRWRPEAAACGESGGASAEKLYIHQRINDAVFRRPDQVMENIARVTAHLAERLRREGAREIERRTLTVIPARAGEPWHRDRSGGWWRTYLFIGRTRAKDCVESPGQARLLGAAIGNFQRMLADLPPPPLHETIPSFHDMRFRYRQLDEALAADAFGRARSVGPELEFFAANRRRGAALVEGLESGSLPARICHNDAKLNNILLDEATGEALCVVDLDTVMPGTALFDFGDLVRTVASTAPEDATDLGRITFSAEHYDALLEGYLFEASEFLVPAETALLAEAGRNLAQIMGLRFLTDYLAGDVYYKIEHASHNLDRSRNQIALIGSMDEARKEIDRITLSAVAGGRRR
jgi:hypothetical protein